MDLKYICAFLLLCPLEICGHNYSFTLEKFGEVRQNKKLLKTYKTGSVVSHEIPPLSQSSRLKRQSSKEDENEDYEESESGEGGGSSEDSDDSDDDNYEDYDDDGEVKKLVNRLKKKKPHSKLPQTKVKILTAPPEKLYPVRGQTKLSVPELLTSTTQKPLTFIEDSSSLNNGEVVVDWESFGQRHLTRGNKAPRLARALTKLAVTAGKVFRYIIDEDAFLDPEEGVNIRLSMYHTNLTILSNVSWVQFQAKDREVYGLPLQSHEGQWSFIIEAKDSEGLTATSPLEITVQRTKEARNHIFVMDFKLKQLFLCDIDWQIRALEGVVNFLRNIYMEQLTVFRAMKKRSEADIYELVWTYDSISDEFVCPIEEITKLLITMADGYGTPSPGLKRAMLPELEILTVKWTRLGVCATSASQEATVVLPSAFPPEIVNELNLITAMEGHLMVQKIPEETFVDPEDGNTRNLALSLRYADNSELPHGYWLQLDPETQELYGLPGTADVGSVTYKLIAEDSSQKKADENFIVEVMKAPQINPSAEFRMVLDFPFLDLAFNAANKRKLVENIALLFGHKDTSMIRIASIMDVPSTTVIWYNTTLQTEECPSDEIQELQEYINGDGSEDSTAHFKRLADKVFDIHMTVVSLNIVPLGSCLDDLKYHMNEAYAEAIDSTRPPHTASRRHIGNPKSYLYYDNSAGIDTVVTFVLPALIIFVLVIVTGAVFAVLIRKSKEGGQDYPRVRII